MAPTSALTFTDTHNYRDESDGNWIVEDRLTVGGMVFHVVDRTVTYDAASATADTGIDLPSDSVLYAVELELVTALTLATATTISIGSAADPDVFYKAARR